LRCHRTSHNDIQHDSRSPDHPSGPANSSDPSDRRESIVIQVIDRIFRVALQPHSTPRRTATLKDLQTIRSALMRCIDDCEGIQVERLRHQIDKARNVQELWMLRNDAYQLVSQQHNQSQAAERINRLLSVFEGWIAPSQLTRIR
jgi:hypothetical protein